MVNFFDTLSAYFRRKSGLVSIGTLSIGSSLPIAPQSMATAPTTATQRGVDDAVAIAKSGGKIIRYTASSVAEAKALQPIKEAFNNLGFKTPLVADVHFNPMAAFTAAQIVEKVRINPGNFGSLPRGAGAQFTAEEYSAELEEVATKFKKLLALCRENNTALRIGVNHGSLSSRIMSRFGDSVEGMCESAMEFLRICKDEDFKNVVISMKSSNVAIMVRAYRSIVAAMKGEGMDYALHLGVTEAGEGEDGRVRSTVGIGALLSDGMGDTLRVSLTEPVENEIFVADKIINYLSEREEKSFYNGDCTNLDYNPQGYSRRESFSANNFGSEYAPIVLYTPLFEGDCGYGEDINTLNEESITLTLDSLEKHIPHLLTREDIVVIFEDDTPLYSNKARLFALLMQKYNLRNRLILKRLYSETSLDDFMVKASVDFGLPLVDGLVDGLWLGNRQPAVSGMKVVEIAFSILQSSRARFTKTEFISCPGCGRTQFSLQESVRRVKECCKDFRGLKIAVMGCIVNGPGEMADADFGYVGAGNGKVNLYRGKEVIAKGIDEDEAPSKLVELIERYY